MAEEKKPERKEETLNSNDLAFERTMLAYERTLMAWVRTAISLFSFGFTIYKFFEEVSKKAQNQLLTPRLVGMIMISFGLLSLILAQIQHQAAVKKLRASYPGVKTSLSSILGVLVLLFGLTLFLAALFRQ